MKRHLAFCTILIISSQVVAQNYHKADSLQGNNHLTTVNHLSPSQCDSLYKSKGFNSEESKRLCDSVYYSTRGDRVIKRKR